MQASLAGCGRRMDADTRPVIRVLAGTRHHARQGLLRERSSGLEQTHQRGAGSGRPDAHARGREGRESGPSRAPDPHGARLWRQVQHRVRPETRLHRARRGRGLLQDAGQPPQGGPDGRRRQGTGKGGRKGGRRAQTQPDHCPAGPGPRSCRGSTKSRQGGQGAVPGIPHAGASAA